MKRNGRALVGVNLSVIASARRLLGGDLLAEQRIVVALLLQSTLCSGEPAGSDGPLANADGLLVPHATSVARFCKKPRIV